MTGRSTHATSYRLDMSGPHAWRADAACAHAVAAGRADHDWWVIHTKGGGVEGNSTQIVTDDNRTAIGICRGCPVRATCLDYGLSQRDRWLVLGALTPRQRNNIARSRARRALTEGEQLP